ncbi:Hypothetical predicted protein [Octopus vulgaris]|uniref:Uncharacterized protein n=1 Tax=Octopus vulgaris TaxID=6645 RepID=A0AA36AWX1_OCTVU|nr:Hypothetical predicted protein [Octopus vulgaris]
MPYLIGKPIIWHSIHLARSKRVLIPASMIHEYSQQQKKFENITGHDKVVFSHAIFKDQRFKRMKRGDAAIDIK